MTPYEFLVYAEGLLKEPTHAALCRSAVSRAYYGAFHHVKAFIESAGITVLTGPEGHMDVRNHLAGVGDADIEQVGKDIADLRGARNDADYKLSDVRLEKQANVELEVAKARDIVDRINTCKSNNSRCTSVQTAIKRAHQTLRGLS